MTINIQQTKEAARGKWRGILCSMGVGEAHLTKKHGPCPMCGGKDRFRFDNLGGEGTWFCSGCGSGDGFSLAQKVTRLGFREVVQDVARIVGTTEFKSDAIPAERSQEDILEANRKVWRQTAKMEAGNLVDTYLRARGVGQERYVADLRCGLALWDGEGGSRPCMVAMVRDSEGGFVSLHRTFLSKDGKAKAEMASPRKMMPGAIAKGSAIRLMTWESGPLGIAEGIETAFAASLTYGVPVWAAVNAQMLAEFQWPDTCKDLFVFGDNDGSFTGQAAAFALGKRAKAKGLSVQVFIPGLIAQHDMEDTDWADLAKPQIKTLQEQG